MVAVTEVIPILGSYPEARMAWVMASRREYAPLPFLLYLKTFVPLLLTIEMFHIPQKVNVSSIASRSGSEYALSDESKS